MTLEDPSFDATNSRCLNCEASVADEFCSGCGQKASTGRLETRELIKDLATHALNLDSVALRTILELTLRPGRLCIGYVQGRRIPFVPPLRYFLVILALVILVNVLTGFDPAQAITAAPQNEVQAEFQQSISKMAIKHTDWAVFGALPWFILAVQWTFRRSRHTYAEVSVFVLYVLGHSLLLGLLLTPLKVVSAPGYLIVKVFLQAFLFAWAGGQFFAVPTWVAALKSVLLTLIYLFLVTVMVMLLTLPRLLSLANG